MPKLSVIWTGPMEETDSADLKFQFSNMGWGADLKTFQQKSLPTSDSVVSLVLKDFDLADYAPDTFMWNNFSMALVGTWEGLKQRRPARTVKGWIRADWEGTSVAIALPENTPSLRTFLGNLREFLLANHETLKTHVVTLDSGPEAQVQMEIITSL